MICLRSFSLASALILSTIALSSCVSAQKTQGISADFTYLISDECAGRLPGTEGNQAAQHYIAQAFAQDKLAFLPGQSQYACAYQQDVYDPSNCGQTLTVTALDGTQTCFTAGVDFYPYTGDSSAYNGVLTCDSSQTGGILFGQQSNVDFTGPQIIQNVRNSAHAEIPTDSLPFFVPDTIYNVLSDGATLSLSEASIQHNATANNVIGVLAGKDRSMAIVISAHFDHIGGYGQTIYSGALDNASGVCTMLEIARQLVQRDVPPVDIVFCAVNGEDMGLLGSKAIVTQNLLGQYKNVNILNLDTVGYNETDRWLISQESAPLAQQLGQALRNDGLDCFTGEYGRSDHISFNDAGLPAVSISSDLVSDGKTPIHTPADNAEIVELSKLQPLASSLVHYLLSGTALVPTQTESSRNRTVDMDEAEILHQELYDANRESLPDYHHNLLVEHANKYFSLSYLPPFTDISSWRNDYPDITLPESSGDYHWSQAVIDNYVFNLIPTSTNGPEWLHWTYVPSNASIPDALPALQSAASHRLLSVLYTNENGDALLVNIHKDISVSDTLSTVEIQQDGLSFVKYLSEDSTLGGVAWMPDSGEGMIETQPLAFRSEHPDETELIAVLLDVVHALDYTLPNL